MKCEPDTAKRKWETPRTLYLLGRFVEVDSVGVDSVAADIAVVDFVAVDSVVSGFVALDSVVVDFAVWGLGASHRKTITPTKLCPLRQAAVRFPTGPKVFGCTPR